jgi:hypothetical protein
VERGRPAPVVDAVGWVVGVPAKILMLDHRVDNHKVSPETEEAIRQYLAVSGLDKVKVRVNQYDPAGEWQRLRDNHSVSGPVRYTIGTLSVVGYTVFPGRVFGGDQYNPYTNSVYLYSDVPAMAVYQGGYARDFATKEDRDLYAVGYAVPGVNLWHGAKAADEAIDYLDTNGTPGELKDGYRTICPAYAGTVPSVATVANVPLTLPAIAVGLVVGQVKAARVADKPAPAVVETRAEQRPEQASAISGGIATVAE